MSMGAIVFIKDHEIIKYLHLLLFLNTEIFLYIRKVPIHAVITIVADDLAMQGAMYWPCLPGIFWFQLNVF